MKADFHERCSLDSIYLKLSDSSLCFAGYNHSVEFLDSCRRSSSDRSVLRFPGKIGSENAEPTGGLADEQEDSAHILMLSIVEGEVPVDCEGSWAYDPAEFLQDFEGSLEYTVVEGDLAYDLRNVPSDSSDD